MSTTLSSASQHESYVIGLLIGADPIVYGSGHNLADSVQGQGAIFPHQINEPLLPEFAKIVFWFGYTVAIGQKEFPSA